jgi:hypothetical protein
MPYVVWIVEDVSGYVARCRWGRGRPRRAGERVREVWSKRFLGQDEALSFLPVAVAVAERLTWRREAARLTALAVRRHLPRLLEVGAVGRSTSRGAWDQRLSDYS